MDDKQYEDWFMRFKQTASDQFAKTLNALELAGYAAAMEVIHQSTARGGRLHVTGIGKPSYVAGYTASLLSSTGTPAYFLDGTEAIHGSSGQVKPGDVVICISNSGESIELIATAQTLKRNGAVLISVCGNAESSIARLSDVQLSICVDDEGGPLCRAPRNSILAELLVLQGLTVLLQLRRELTLEEYLRFHPGGALGKSG